MERAREWLQSCVNAATRSGVPEEADLEAFLLAHIDGEPARLAAAREELREHTLSLERQVGDLRKMYESAERDAAARYDCKGGPGTTVPACGGCVTCLHRVIEQAEARAEKAEAQVAAARETVFVVDDGQQVLGAYETKEQAQARAVEYVKSEKSRVREWYRYDGAWQFHYKLSDDENWLTMRVTECEVSN